MGKSSVSVMDRLISSLTYITSGWVGIIYLVIMAIGKKNTTSFIRFNVFQSVLISLLYFCFNFVLGILMNILSVIPLLNGFVYRIYSFLFNFPLINITTNYRLSIIESIIIGIFLYLAVFALLGKRPRIYRISNLIDSYAR